MKGYVENIEEKTVQNSIFRTVLYTSNYMQLVVMSIEPAEEIGMEVHGQDQFLRIEAGTGKVVLDGEEQTIEDGTAIVVPAGTQHNVINTGTEPLKLYTIYAPPHHKDGVVHQTKADAERDEEQHADEFLGDTTDA